MIDLANFEGNNNCRRAGSEYRSLTRFYATADRQRTQISHGPLQTRIGRLRLFVPQRTINDALPISQADSQLEKLCFIERRIAQSLFGNGRQSQIGPQGRLSEHEDCLNNGVI